MILYSTFRTLNFAKLDKSNIIKNIKRQIHGFFSLIIWRHWRRSGVFIVNFEHITHFFVVFLLFTLNK